jgi:cystathionine beta-lyase/cystathionine gamma-synthase
MTDEPKPAPHALDTLCAHAGDDPDEPRGPLSMPICQSSTFRLGEGGEWGDYFYTRIGPDVVWCHRRRRRHHAAATRPMPVSVSVAGSGIGGVWVGVRMQAWV